MTASPHQDAAGTRRVTLLYGPEGTVSLRGPAVERRAVRAVVRDDAGRLLVLRTARGAVKLPGGGVEPGESDEEALLREVREECGLEVREILGEVGEIVEVSAAHAQDPFDVFRMTSRYLACRVGDRAAPPTLSAAEVALGLRAEWLPVHLAVAANTALVASAGAGSDHRFVRRETLALGWVVEDDGLRAGERAAGPGRRAT